MEHPYRFDEAAAVTVAAAADIARSTLARHAAEVDGAARFPDEGVAALAQAGLFGLCVTANG